MAEKNISIFSPMNMLFLEVLKIYLVHPTPLNSNRGPACVNDPSRVTRVTLFSSDSSCSTFSPRSCSSLCPSRRGQHTLDCTAYLSSLRLEAWGWMGRKQRKKILNRPLGNSRLGTTSLVLYFFFSQQIICVAKEALSRRLLKEANSKVK